MFCMGCGAEVPPRAVACAVCGRETSRVGEPRVAPAPADAYDGAGVAGALSAPLEHPAPPVPVPVPIAMPMPAPALATGPSIGSGDLDQAGFPRDALGRSLIFTVLAMAADLLAPWVNLGGSRVAPSSLGLPALLGLAWLSLAALPLLRPSLRATPIYAAAPLVVGATSLGLASALWLRVTLLGSQTVVSSIDGASLQATGAANSADVGLYLFLAGAVVLIVAGYQVLVAAARAQALAELRAEGVAPAPARAGTAPAAGAPLGQWRAASGNQPALAGQTPAAALGNGAVPAAAADSRPLPPPPASVPSGMPSPHQGVALPGSAAWSQTPNTPSFQRPSPSLGWRRRGP